jgi:hypothetical protein
MSKTQSLENSYMKYEPMSLTKSQERRIGNTEKGSGHLATIALVGVLAVTGAIEVYNKVTDPASRSVPEIVRAYDNPTTVSQRAENQFGTHPDRFNIRDEAQRISDEYGTLQPGEKIEVHVK